jgi:MFS family permease
VTQPGATVTRAAAHTTTVGLISGTLGAIGLIDGGGGGVWADVLSSFGLADSILGPAFATQSAFVFPVLLFGGLLLSTVGIRIMLVAGTLLLAATSFAFTGLHGLALFIALFAIRGTGLALLDLAGNTMAMHVERDTGRHIMGIVHGGFSVGIVIGSLIAFGVYSIGGSFRAIHITLGALMLAVAVAGLLGPVPGTENSGAPPRVSLRAFNTPLVRICGIALGLGFGAELLISQFVSVLLRTRIEASEATSVLAVVIYATMMAIGRFGNGPLLDRFDPITLLCAQGATFAIGGAIIATSTSAPVTLLGSLIGGLGVAGAVPTVLSYAASHSRSSAGEIAGASLFGGYFGALLLPLLAGGLTSLLSIRAGIALVSVAGLLTIWCGIMLRQDERSSNRVVRRRAGPAASG